MTNHQTLRSVIALCLIVGSQADSYNRNYLDDPEAKCLDGSTPSYYFLPGSGDGANKFLVYFQGGGWIGGRTVADTLESAYERSFGDVGTSKWNGPTRDWGNTGIFARNQENNPSFYNWNSIHINYCDGTGHQGYKKEPITVKDKVLWFRGETNTKAVISSLQAKYNFRAAEQVLLSGCSAGGLAIFNWASYFRDLFPSTTKVMAAPDSGVFLDMLPFKDDPAMSYRNQYFVNFMQIANVEVDPINSKCVAAILIQSGSA